MGKQVLLYSDGLIDTYYVHMGNKHLILQERDNKVVHTQDITYNIRDKNYTDKLLRQLGEPTTRQLDKRYRKK